MPKPKDQSPEELKEQLEAEDNKVRGTKSVLVDFPKK